LHGKIYAQFRCEHVTFSVLHADAKTWPDADTFQVKYLVNAVNFERILYSDRLVF